MNTQEQEALKAKLESVADPALAAHNPEIISTALSMAALMTDVQKDDMVAVMIVRQVLMLFTRETFTEAAMVCRSPFNEDYPVAIAATTPTLNGSQVPVVSMMGRREEQAEVEDMGMFIIDIEGAMSFHRFTEDLLSDRAEAIINRIQLMLADLNAAEVEEAEKEAA